MNNSNTFAERKDRFIGNGSIAVAAKGWMLREGVQRARHLATCYSILVLGITNSASAQEEPHFCDTIGSAAILRLFPSTARHGDELCAWVEISNLTPGSCNATVDAELSLGDGSIVTVMQGALLYQGDSFICPGDDPRCVADSNCTLDADGIPGGPLIRGYGFIVEHVDEHGAIGNACPPTPASGMGREHVSLSYAATVHMVTDVEWNSCTVVPIAITHESCTDACDGGEVCLGGICMPLPCNQNGICDLGENCSTCEDCMEFQYGCGNGVCESSLRENCLNCPADCNGQLGGKPGRQFCCGAGSKKSPGGCDDSRCTSRGYACTATSVSSCCGNATCEGFENSCNCAIDCGPALTQEDFSSIYADGIDNDCDGLTDSSDPDCPCGAKGSSCASNADCCSDICTRQRLCR